MNEVFELLDKLDIKYERYDTGKALTCAESTELLPENLRGVRSKHLFVRDRRKKNYFMVLVEENKRVDLKALSDVLGVKSLSMVSRDKLQDFFDIPDGSLSMTSYVKIKDTEVKLVIDEEVWNDEAIDCHPNVNEIVLLIDKPDWEKFLNHFKIEPQVLQVPEVI